MPTISFQNLTEFNKFMETALINSYLEIAKIIFEKFLEYIRLFYDDYKPTYYLREDMLEDKAKISNVNINDTKIDFDIGYFSDYLAGFQYETGSRPTGEDILESVLKGLHGAYGMGEKGYNGHNPFEDFRAWCDNNYADLVAKTMRKYGVVATRK